MKPQAWFTRKFGQQPDFVFPAILERLEGTPLRLEYKIQQIHPTLYTKKIPNDKWTIQEQVGHLLDLEPLWMGRFQEILSKETDLREADLSSQKTVDAQYNQQLMETILADFRVQRSEIVALLKQVEVTDLDNFALHPRLKTPMTVTNLAYFVAEYDDHHLAYMTYLAS